MADDDVRMTVRVRKSDAERIAALAERMNVSQSAMAGMLLEEGLADNEWVVRVVTSRFSQSVLAVFGKGPKGRKASRRKHGEG